MSDLISRQAAIEAIWKPKVIPGGEVFEALKRAQQNEIELLPAADPADELTCEGCKYDVGGMLYQPCSECMRSAFDNWTAEDEG